MKRLLMPIFGGILLTSSISLSTLQNASVVIKAEKEQKANNQKFLDEGYEINNKSNLTKEEVKEVQAVSKTWNTAAIDRVLNEALEYKEGQLIINKDKLDSNKLPFEILHHINLALDNLNNTVTAGFIKVQVTNDRVKLIYPINGNTNNSTKNNMRLKNDNEIIEFEKTKPTISLMSTNSTLIWISTYGPSHWWRFWEWGAYIHFSEQLMPTAKILNTIYSIVNIVFIFKNIKQILNIIKQISVALSIRNTIKANSLLTTFAKLLNNANLAILGTIFDIVAIFTSVAIFVIAINSIPGAGPLIFLITELITSIMLAVTNQMLAADQGNGVKWQWANFTFPWAITAE